MKVSLIVAMDNQRAIGANNTLPWHLPEDLKTFKRLTMGHHILMGRKTYESIGRPLPGRTTIVLTSNKDFSVEGVKIATSISDALEMAKQDNEEELFVCGGAKVYEQLLDHCKKAYITRVDTDVEADCFFPELSGEGWELKEEVSHEQDQKNPLAWKFQTWERL